MIRCGMRSAQYNTRLARRFVPSPPLRLDTNKIPTERRIHRQHSAHAPGPLASSAAVASCTHPLRPMSLPHRESHRPALGGQVIRPGRPRTRQNLPPPRRISPSSHLCFRCRTHAKPGVDDGLTAHRIGADPAMRICMQYVHCQRKPRWSGARDWRGVPTYIHTCHDTIRTRGRRGGGGGACRRRRRPHL